MKPFKIKYIVFLCPGIIDNPSDSLFTYGSSGSWNTFYKPTYEPIFEAVFSDPELEEQALEVLKII